MPGSWTQSWTPWISRQWTAVGAQLRGRRVRLALAAVILAALALGIAAQARAAIELAYYRASSSNVSVLLEWATVHEVNLDGFEILCKRITEDDTAFHPIGSRIAQGNADTGATYSFNVTSGIVYGEAYCFRLREVTNDNIPGEQFDLCGYGPGVTPVPVDTSATMTTTTIVVDNSGGIAGPTFTPTPIPGASPLLTQTIDTSLTPTVTVIPGQPVSPLLTPQGFDPNAGVAGNPQGFAVTETPTPTETPTATPTATLVATATETPTPTATQGSSPLAMLPPPAADTSTAAPAGGPAALEPDPNAVPSTATPLYVVVTATPTSAAVAAAIQPTFTPWPTATAAPTFSFASLLVPSTQNMMVMLLCLIFLSASGLGVLGLITSVLYMRSQARRDRLPGPYYGRRRY